MLKGRRLKHIINRKAQRKQCHNKNIGYSIPFHSKARNIMLCCKQVLRTKHFNSNVPNITYDYTINLNLLEKQKHLSEKQKHVKLPNQNFNQYAKFTLIEQVRNLNVEKESLTGTLTLKRS